MPPILSGTALALTDSAPWWGVPLIAGGFLLLGGVLGFLLNRVQDRARTRREDALRWHDDVRRHAAEMIDAALALSWSISRVRHLDQIAADPERADDHERAARLADEEADTVTMSVNRMRAAAAAFIIIAPDEMFQSAVDLGAAAYDVLNDADEPGATGVCDRYNSLMLAFIRAVRAYLGLTIPLPGETPPPVARP